jgi:hypothetical protein
VLARLKPAGLISVLALGGCMSFPESKSAAAGDRIPILAMGQAVINDDQFMLDAEAPVPLVTVGASVALEDFCDALSLQAAAGNGQGVSYAVSCRASRRRLVRVLRTENQTSLAIHFVLLDRQKADGSRVLSLQPVVAWKTALGGGQTEAVTRTGITGTLNQMRPDLTALAVSAAASL